MMRVLTVSSLWPNKAQPNHGIFVENRMRRVHETGRAEVTVIAPVPWFPSSNPRFGSYSVFANVPREETRHGIRVLHPPYTTIPKIGMRTQPSLYFRSLRDAAKKLIAETGPFDLIDAHYFYPDGVAASRLAAELGIPFTCTARGTDVNLIPDTADYARAAVVGVAQKAAASITVCEALRAALIDLGADGTKVHTLRNGVDLEGFVPPSVKRATLKERWDVPANAPLGVSVGGLVERKGHHLTIEAMAELTDVHFRIAGGGEEQGALEAQIEKLGIGDRVKLLGPVAHNELKDLYGAADFSVLASSREGWANVLLEAMACGTPVVATAIWGTPEVVAAPEAGVLAKERDAQSIREATKKLLDNMPDRAATRAYAEKFSWDDTVAGVLDVFEAALAAHAGSKAA